MRPVNVAKRNELGYTRMHARSTVTVKPFGAAFRCTMLGVGKLCLCVVVTFGPHD